MDIWNDINQGIGSLKNKYAHALDPAAIIKTVQHEAKRNAKRWGADVKPEAPNCYVVHIGTEDWRRYYGSREKTLIDKVSREVYMSLSELQLDMEGYPSITLKQDETIAFGDVYVDATFGDVVPIPRDIGEMKGMPEYIKTVPLSTEKIKQETSEPKIANSANMLVKTAVMPGGKNDYSQAGKKDIPEAILEGCGQSWTVSSGDVIGILRRPEDRAPDIELPYEHFKNMSQRHGIFEYDEENDKWLYTNLSENKTIIESIDGEEPVLDVDEEIALYDGDRIRPSKCEALTFERR